jgi:hypothetical protein
VIGSFTPLFGCACMCMSQGDSADRVNAFAGAAWVIQGRVTAATVLEWSESGWRHTPTSLVPNVISYRIEIQRRWKGEPVDTLTVEAPYLRSTCGATLELGQYYVLYLDRIEEKALLYACTRRMGVVGSYREREWLDLQN